MTAAIRPARAADAPAVAACVAAAYAVYVERLGKPPGPMLDDYAGVIAEHAVFVMTEDDAVVGVVVLIRQDGGLLLDNLAVHPDRQGRGHGGRLIDFAEAEALRRGHEALDLYTHERMTENIALYAARGYRETGRRRVRGYDRVYMRKPLQPPT